MLKGELPVGSQPGSERYIGAVVGLPLVIEIEFDRRAGCESLEVTAVDVYGIYFQGRHAVGLEIVLRLNYVSEVCGGENLRIIGIDCRSETQCILHKATGTGAGPSSTARSAASARASTASSRRQSASSAQHRC